MPSSRGSSHPRDQTQVFRIADDLWILWCLSHQGSPCTHTHTHPCMVVYLALLGLRCCTGLSLAEVSRDPSLVWCTGFPLQQLLLSCRAGSPAFRLQSMGSVAGAHRLSSSEACGVFLGRGLNPCLLHWQATALPLSHQGCPCALVFSVFLELHQLFVNCDACSGSCRDS